MAWTCANPAFANLEWTRGCLKQRIGGCGRKRIALKYWMMYDVGSYELVNVRAVLRNVDDLRVEEANVAKSASIISGPLLLRLVSLSSGFETPPSPNGSKALPVWIERGRNPRRLDIEPEGSDNISVSPTIFDNFDGTSSSILPSAAISFSCCEGFFL